MRLVVPGFVGDVRSVPGVRALLLVLLMAAYLYMGATVFQTLEGPVEEQIQAFVDQTKTRFLRDHPSVTERRLAANSALLFLDIKQYLDISAMSNGYFEKFDLRRDDWTSYIERLEQYFIVNEVGEDLKVATLINSIGKTAYELLTSLCTPSKPSTKPFKELVDLMRGHLQPSPNHLAARCKFRQRTQKRDETIREYAAEILRLSKSCKFNPDTELKPNLRDQFLFGLYNRGTQKQLCAKKKLSFSTAVECAESLEAAEDQQAPGVSGSSVATMGVPFPGYRGRGRARGGGRVRPAPYPRRHWDTMTRHQEQRCRTCAGVHEDTICRFSNNTCYVCKTEGHMSWVCPMRVEESPRE